MPPMKALAPVMKICIRLSRVLVHAPHRCRDGDPADCYKETNAQIIANKTIELLNEFKKRLNAAQPIQYRSNIELVGRYYNQIHPIQRDNQE